MADAAGKTEKKKAVEVDNQDDEGGVYVWKFIDLINFKYKVINEVETLG